MEEASPKESKNENNALIKDGRKVDFEEQFNFEAQTQRSGLNASQQAVENIKHIFNKTQTIRKVADLKHREIKEQFEDLTERLNSSSECLQRMKKGIDNIKFSYQSKIFQMQQSLAQEEDEAELQMPQSREEMMQQMESIKDKIEKIQNNVYTEKAKQEKVMKSYKEAFQHVSQALERINNGDYSSSNPCTSVKE